MDKLMYKLIASFLSLYCMVPLATPAQALSLRPLRSVDRRSASHSQAVAPNSSCHYFVGFTANGQASRGDVCGDQEVKITGLAGSSFLTSKGLLKITGGTLHIETGVKPLNVVAQTRSYTIQPRTRCVFDSRGPVSTLEVRRGLPNLLSARDRSALIDRVRTARYLCRLSARNGAFDPVRIFASHGSLFSVGPRRVVVAQGSLLIDAPADTVIGTPSGYVTCDRRFVTSVRTLSEAVCVENLTVPQPITLTVQGASTTLEAGRGAIVRKGPPCPGAIPLDGLPRRSFTAHTNGGITVITADFMAGALFRSQKHMSESIRRPFTSYQTKLSQELLKGTAAVQVATGGRGAFLLRPASLPAYRLGAVMDPVASQTRASFFNLPPGAILLR